ncbi:MAG: 6-phosphogluconolactonase [Ferruginibacter sp.]
MTRILIFDTDDALFKKVAERIVTTSADFISRKGRFTIALSGGSTPARLYALLATPFFEMQIDWSKWFVFWGDERHVPANSPQNNASAAIQVLLSKVSIPASQVFAVNTKQPAPEAAADYEKIISAMIPEGGLDLVLLGLGTNGHTASLFPHTQVLHNITRKVMEEYIIELDQYRISMTSHFINQANKIFFLVTGKEKSEIVSRILGDEKDKDSYPALYINPESGNLSWYLDAEAAAGI